MLKWIDVEEEKPIHSGELILGKGSISNSLVMCYYRETVDVFVNAFDKTQMLSVKKYVYMKDVFDELNGNEKEE